MSPGVAAVLGEEVEEEVEIVHENVHEAGSVHEVEKVGEVHEVGSIHKIERAGVAEVDLIVDVEMVWLSMMVERGSMCEPEPGDEAT